MGKILKCANLLSEKRQEALELESPMQLQPSYLITGICRIQQAQTLLRIWAKSLSFTNKKWYRDVIFYYFFRVLSSPDVSLWNTSVGPKYPLVPLVDKNTAFIVSNLWWFWKIYPKMYSYSAGCPKAQPFLRKICCRLHPANHLGTNTRGG